jgi:CBS domain-containing protein
VVIKLLERVKNFDVAELLSPPLIVSSVTPVSKIIGLLKEANAYEVFIEDHEKIGMITLRDILKASNLSHVKAETLTFTVPKLTNRTRVAEAARLMMEYRIRSLPIVSDNGIVDSVTALSIIDLLNEMNFLNHNVTAIMTRQPTTLDSNALASKARQLMIRRQIDHVPVISGIKPIGVVTSAHLVYNMFQATESLPRSTIVAEEQKKLEIPVRSIMDTHTLSCESNDKISSIFGEMQRLGTTSVLVTFGDELQGIITYRDYMKLIHTQFTPDEIPISIQGLNPRDYPFELEMARHKFRRVVTFLKKSLPFIEEARSTIRAFPSGDRGRKRFEVKVSIVTPKRIFNYSEEGWELSEIYDSLSIKLRTILQKQRRNRAMRRDSRLLDESP